MARELAVALISGGMDSCVCAAIAAEECELAALHIAYGQRTEQREREAFTSIADHYGIPAHRRLLCSIAHLAAIGGSSLTDARIPVHEGGVDDSAVPTSYVPFRNAHFLSIAVSWAEVIGATRIYIGAVQDDSSGYPDCRAEYYEAFNRLAEVGTKPGTHISIVTPVIHTRKDAIIRRGLELGAPLHLTWSCYQQSDRACGRCDSCRLRLAAFSRAGVEDPIPYETEPEVGP